LDVLWRLECLDVRNRSHFSETGDNWVWA
jgi:hypothetical protein